MIQEIKQMAQRALNRLNNVLSRGVLTDVKTGKLPTITTTLFDKETIEGIQFPQDWGFISYPPKDGNTELVVAFLGGQRDQGTVLNAFNRESPPTKLTLQEGESAIYNKVTNTYVHLKADGTIHIKSDSSMTMTIPQVTLTGNLTVKGDIIDNSDTNSHNVRNMRTIFNAHVHSGVSPGGSNSGSSTTSQ